MSNSIDTSALLTQLRSMAREAGVPTADVASARTSGIRRAGVARAGALADEGAPDGDFTRLLQRSIEGVNERSQQARAMSVAFESGSPDVQLADVMIAVQKARVSFEALTQVRNKMVSAYQDIMSTPL